MEELRGKAYADMLRELGRQSMLETVEGPRRVEGEDPTSDSISSGAIRMKG